MAADLTDSIIIKEFILSGDHAIGVRDWESGGKQIRSNGV